MAVIGFGFTKLLIEKKGNAVGKISINNNISLKDVKDVELNLGKQKQKAVNFNFEFTSKYEPNIGDIAIEGELICVFDEKKTKEIKDEWKKSKSVPKDIMISVLTNVLNKCNIEALLLSKELSLPAPIPLPKVELSPEKEVKK